MSIRHPSKYGQGAGPYKLIPKVPYELDLRKGGVNVSVPADKLQEGETPNALDVRLDEGGVSTDFGVSNFGSISASAADRTILHVAPYQKEDATRLMMRLRPTRWDRWNGLNWLELPGVLTGGAGNRLYSTVMKNKFIAANGIDRLKAWDGVDANAVADLSADAPRAAYITRIGNRLFAARIDSGGLKPNLVAWSADGLITDWTTANLGAGSTERNPEGSSKAANYITGLSTLARGVAIYRQRSIELASLTGVGAAPFRFQTIDFDHGTESPYSIAAGGPKGGDYFLGHDYVVYNFDGVSAPTPIGLPIAAWLRANIFDLGHVVGAVDTKRMEYWLGVPTASDLRIRTAWCFSIKEWVETGRHVWRRRDLGDGYTALGYGIAPIVNDPVLNSVPVLMDTIAKKVNDYALAIGSELILLGSHLGQVQFIDETIPLTSGLWDSRQFGEVSRDLTVDVVRITYKSQLLGQVELSISADGGRTYSSPRVLNLEVSPIGTLVTGETFGVTGRQFIVRIRILQGFLVVSKINVSLDDRGSRGI